ncbi:hypothetical protein PHYBLDRAFT_171578 [Phycomyces blakesleeanus NRRL 1555(-)]|uniref:Uncharacterized protein n=1 Tax=Phycomyces blakesleeanus (strain ATCC 8743b / DSM 1359 / FGSC 10004 / NBRC 33097 / NRRL 1555) TaxID=763407 RepID=A0A162NJB1_PHYB8|nr:hypothetical protein PHYBLDRAFT_171578 [Phycomyces blakesleeanus NRRL 1555(-)]OAD70194.1 hypothetical protein PHYBLDRAFT_171578 [Phycomyces blakesleeanus NRRL 1555(-)]|eukprot:XP_018288234.1 hypothetical protein PHYBLDRAFT_171578 [Phycomyces blakesleeanus NRRL 1555(-)]
MAVQKLGTGTSVRKQGKNTTHKTLCGIFLGSNSKYMKYSLVTKIEYNVNRHFNYFNGVEFHKFLSSEEDQTHELIYNSHHVLAEMSLSEHRALKINFLFFSFSLTSDVDSRILLANTHDRKFYVRDAGGYSSVSSITRAVSALQLVQLYIYVFNQTAIV